LFAPFILGNRELEQLAAKKGWTLQKL